MEYKKDVRYIIGVILATVSVLTMVVTFIMMYFGSDPAIIWFFAGGVGLVIANFILVWIKRRYERMTDDEPTNLEILKDNILNLKASIFKRGRLGAAFLLVLVLSFVLTVIFGTRTLITSYEKSGAINAGYNFNLREAERYKGIMEEQLKKGNLKFAAECEKNMNKCLEESEWYLQYHGELSEKLEKQRPQFLAVATVNVVLLIAYVAFVLVYKKSKAEDKGI